MFSLKGFVKRENNVTMAKNMTILKAMRNICSLIGTFFFNFSDSSNRAQICFLPK